MSEQPEREAEAIFRAMFDPKPDSPHGCEPPAKEGPGGYADEFPMSEGR
jgi:hypothetical protein